MAAQWFASTNSHSLRERPCWKNVLLSQQASRGQKSMRSRAGMQSQWQWLLWARGKSWKNTWESRKGAVLGNQEEFLLEMSGILKFIIPQPTPVPAWLWEHTRTGKTEVFHPKFPKKRQNPSCTTPVGQRHLLFIIFHVSHHHIW